MAGTNELHWLSIGEASQLIEKGSLSPLELTRAVLERIQEVDGRLKAFVTLLDKEAEASARAAEESIRRGQYRGPLHGIPVAIKDLYDTAGVKTTSCSKLRESYVPKTDCTVVRKLREAGAIILGKVTTHEFAFGFDSRPTRTPWNLDYTPSGSSGGSGSALAAGMCLGATGSDTGGSVRAPAAVNGIAGIKPTYGRVSKQGVAVLSWSLDTTGPMARTVKDLALMLSVMAGHDPLDETTADVPVPDYVAALTGEIRGMRVGVPKNYFFDDVQPHVAEAVQAALKTLEAQGASLVEVTIPDAEYIVPIFFSIVIPEAASYHHTAFQERGQEYGDDVRALLETGEMFLATTYITAQRARAAFKNTLREAFRGINVLATPTLPVTAAKAGQATYRFGDRDEPVFAAFARFCCPFNLTGLPAVSVPCGFSPDGLPIGLQLVGKPFDETSVLRAADAFERTTDWHTRRPQI
jgi:aspartyl-tRNA(Asn)/glutamyl-tRNA(Gln) amidotransferase subunit A